MATYRDPVRCFAPLEVIERLLEIRAEAGYSPSVYLLSPDDLADYLDAYGFDVYALSETEAGFHFGDYRAPLAWLYVLAPDADGQMQRFSAEGANPQRLSRDGITADRLKPGDVVRVTGSPGRTPSERKIHLKRIERPADGWTWGGMGGRGGRGGRGGQRR